MSNKDLKSKKWAKAREKRQKHQSEALAYAILRLKAHYKVEAERLDYVILGCKTFKEKLSHCQHLQKLVSGHPFFVPLVGKTVISLPARINPPA